MPKLYKLYRIFCLSVAVLLTLTAVAKLIALVQGKAFLSFEDPVITSLKFKTRDSLALASALELAGATYIFFRRNHVSSAVVCCWLTSLFVSYRMLARAFFASKPCSCLGGVLDWTGLPPYVLDAIPVMILCWMGFGGFFFLSAFAMVRSQVEHANDGEATATLKEV